jgi:2-oxoisovalerate ferredoxin oxidoreductase gamma subunit
MPLTEIVFNGRGGQGAVTAANILADAALASGYEGVQAFPLFGAERRGAPVKAFARISRDPIYLRSQIYEPDIVLVLDPGIMDTVNVTAGLKKDGTIIINTPRNRADINLPYRVGVVDATGIAIDRGIVVGGIPIVNTPMIGTLSQVIENLSMSAVKKAILQRWAGEAGKNNAAAANDAYEALQIS